MTEGLHAPPGAVVEDGGVRFTVWAPDAREVELHVVDPYDKVIGMRRDDRGYAGVLVDGLGAGARYSFRLDGDRELPDPASRWQPDGVHEASAVTDAAFPWTDGGWTNIDLPDLVIYEAHVGTLTQQGTFDAAIEVLSHLQELGVNALELMPVAQFPGGRNWGYDGVYPYAPQNSYGGPDGLRRLVDAAHARGIAVVLDVVYNHLGPEGCYLDAFGPYFTDRYATPWGRAINFDGPGSDEVRRFFVGNALHWFEHFHVDALRLDAVHAIADPSAYPFLEELSEATEALGESLGRKLWLIAESSANDARIITSRERGGYGLDAQWNDDLHHALYTLVTGDRDGYFADYGEPSQLARALREGYVYQGERSTFRDRRHGRRSAGLEPHRFVVFANNHDQIGNRAAGDRLSTRVDDRDLRLMATILLLQPGVPLLFMGEEYAETAPFAYFVSHSDPRLVEAVREGRRSEFAGFAWQGEVPDPQDASTFDASRIDRSLLEQGRHREMFELYRQLLQIRREHAAITRPHRRDASADGEVVRLEMADATERIVVGMNLGTTPARVDLDAAPWQVLIASGDDGAIEDGELLVPPRTAVAVRTQVA